MSRRLAGGRRGWRSLVLRLPTGCGCGRGCAYAGRHELYVLGAAASRFPGPTTWTASSAKSDDNGTGTSEQPFHTITKPRKSCNPASGWSLPAASIASVSAPRGAAAVPINMISYEAAPGAAVFVGKSLKPSVTAGSRVPLTGGVEAVPARSASGSTTSGDQCFRMPTIRSGMVTMLGDRAWLDTKTVDIGPYFI